MEKAFDHVIRGGTIADGSGRATFEGDIAIKDGRIAEVGKVTGSGREESDARGLLVTPGFIDIHTHYDGQVTWEDTLSPSSDNGVTSVVLGNCGVGFAPCRPADRDTLMKLMEGIEDLPEPVLSAGVPWTWESFGDYLDFLEARHFDIDVATQVPHAAVRIHAMGERAMEGGIATDDDNTAMAAIVRDAVKAGALGFSTSRTLLHKASDGRLTPTFAAAEAELTTIAKGVSEAGTGVLQAIFDFSDPEEELPMLARICRASGRPLSISLLQRHGQPGLWREVLRWLEEMNAEGLTVRAQIGSRPIGALAGLDISSNPLARAPSYEDIAARPLAERVAALRDPALRARIVAELEALPEGSLALDKVYPLGKAPNYEPEPGRFIAPMAKARGVSPVALMYDLLLEDEGNAILSRPTSNYAEGSLDVCGEMIRHPNTVIGLADGGAHVGYLCDASQPTFVLSHWARDRAHDRLPVEQAVRALTADPAAAMGLGDRGMIAPGYRADINVIDFDRLALEPPSVSYDLPAGGRRLRQNARGYRATMVGGTVIARDGKATGARPGRLVRGARALA